MLLSCPQTDETELRPMLETMTGKLVYLGDDPMRAASFKLAGNLFIVAITGGLADVNRFAGSVGIATDDIFSLFDFFDPAASVARYAAKMTSGDFSPRWELTMARKDTRLMIEESQRHGVTLGIIPAVAATFDDAIARAATGRSIRPRS